MPTRVNYCFVYTLHISLSTSFLKWHNIFEKYKFTYSSGINGTLIIECGIIIKQNIKVTNINDYVYRKTIYYKIYYLKIF